MKKIVPLLLSACVISACTTPGYNTEIVNQKNDRGPQTAAIDYRDLNQAIQENISGLLNSPILANHCPALGNPCVVAISNITNDTTQRFDTDAMIKDMRIQMLNSGRFIITTGVGVYGPEDKLLNQKQDLRESAEFNQSTVSKLGSQIAPDYTLSGKIYEDIVTLDDGRSQIMYAFSLTMTDFDTALAHWEGETKIVKRANGQTVNW